MIFNFFFKKPTFFTFWTITEDHMSQMSRKSTWSWKSCLGEGWNWKIKKKRALLRFTSYLNNFFLLSSSLVIGHHVENYCSAILRVNISTIKFQWDEPLFFQGLSSIWGLPNISEKWPFDINLEPHTTERKGKSGNQGIEGRDVEFNI